MIRGLRAAYEQAHDVTIRDEAVVAAVRLSPALHLRPAAAGQGGGPARHRPRARVKMALRARARTSWWRWSRSWPRSRARGRARSGGTAPTGRSRHPEDGSPARGRSASGRAGRGGHAAQAAGRSSGRRWRALQEGAARSSTRPGADGTRPLKAVGGGRRARSSARETSRWCTPEVDDRTWWPRRRRLDGHPRRQDAQRRRCERGARPGGEARRARPRPGRGPAHGRRGAARPPHAGIRNPRTPIGVLLFVGPSRRGQDGDGPRARRRALRRRALHDHHQHERVPGEAHRVAR